MIERMRGFVAGLRGIAIQPSRWSLRLLGITGVLILGSALVVAQTTPVTSTAVLSWDQGGVADAAAARALTYRYYPDGTTTGIVVSGVTCEGVTVIVCRAPFPAFTPGNHTLTLTAANVAGESAKSAPLTFTFVVVPGTPTNLRVAP